MVSPRGSRRAHISPNNFSGKNYQKLGCFLCYKNKTRGDIFEEKGISEQFYNKKESNNDPTESNTISQSNNKSC